MPEKSGFFDSTADDIRSYPARDFAEYFSRFITNGVFNGGLNLEVTATGNDASVRLSPGYAWINGYVYSVYDQPIVLGIQPATTQDRIDRIILRLDTSTPVRAIRAIVLQGTPNANPVPPALVRSGSIYDLSLAQVRVKANSTIIAPANITDERLNEAVCGLVNSLIKVDTATFQRQWDEFIARVQNQGFATPELVTQKANAAETNAKGYVDGKVWQKHRLTEDSGRVLYIPGGDANTLTTTGFYVGDRIANAPRSGEGNWYYINVYAMAPGVWVKQIAMDMFTNKLQMRTGSDVGGHIGWGPWTEDLFTSVANGKQAIATAISGKGIAASGSEEFAALASKISQISTGVQVITGNFASGSVRTISNLPFRPRIVLVNGNATTGTDSNNGKYASGSGPTVAYDIGNGTQIAASTSISLGGPGYTGSNAIAFSAVTLGTNSVTFTLSTNVSVTSYVVFGY